MADFWDEPVINCSKYYAAEPRNEQHIVQSENFVGDRRDNKKNAYTNSRYLNNSSQSSNYNKRGPRRGNNYNTYQDRNFGNNHKQQDNDSVAYDSNKTIEDESQLIDWDNIDKHHENYLKETFGHFPPVIRKTYIENKRVAQMTAKEVSSIRKEKNSIVVTNMDGTKPEYVPNPVTQFHEAFENFEEIMNIIRKSGFTEPSPIQCQLWPIIMSGYDSIGIAQTGTGKTLAFLLPALVHINTQAYYRDPERRGPLCIIMAPTRELAQQIHEECNKFKYKGIRSVCVYGQGNYKLQCKALQDGVEIVVATPGRLYDFIQKDTCDVRGVSYLVLDEADRMLDMGFLPDISKITYSLRPDKQVILTSATWACDVEFVTKQLMKHDKLKVVVGELDLAAVGSVTQSVNVCEEEDKYEAVANLLLEIGPNDKVLVFANRRAVVDYFVSHLLQRDIKCNIMHGGLDQDDRENSLKELKSGVVQILLATDVASRGLDIKDLTMVVNMDLPKNLEEYVHRCGRTGRAGKFGKVITFVTWQNRSQAQELIDIFERTNQEVPKELVRLAHRFKVQQENRPPSQPRGNFRGGRSRGRDRY